MNESVSWKRTLALDMTEAPDSKKRPHATGLKHNTPNMKKNDVRKKLL